MGLPYCHVMDTRPDLVRRFFHPVLAARALRKKPVRVELAGQAYVLFRDGRGQPAALLDRCPHRFSPLSAGRVREVQAIFDRHMQTAHAWR